MTQNECFQIAKLALFNVKLLNELENIGHEELKNLIKDVHEKLSIEEKPALINQSTYLQFGNIHSESSVYHPLIILLLT